MSVDATRFVWKLSKNLISPSQKLFLLSVADRCGENGECFPSLARLSADTGLDRKTLIDCRKDCIQLGVLNYTGEFKGKSNQIPVMRLNFNERREWESPIDKIIIRTEKGTSTKNGTGTSTKNGTLNLSVESTKEPVCDTSPNTVDYSLQNHTKNDIPLSPTQEKSNCSIAKKEALSDTDCLELFKKKFEDYEVNYEKLYDLAQEKCGKPYKPVGKNGFYNFILTQKDSFYVKKSKFASPKEPFLEILTEREKSLLQEYQHSRKYRGVFLLSEAEIEEAKKLIIRLTERRGEFIGNNLIKNVSHQGVM